MKIDLLMIAAGWLCCGAFAYAICFGHMQNNPAWRKIAMEEYHLDLGHSISVGLFGPIGLLVSLLTTGFAQHGLKWR